MIFADPTNSGATEKEKGENPLLKLLLEIGPLIIFFFAYNNSERVAGWFGLGEMAPILIATAVFIPTMGAALLVSWMLQGRIPVMPLVSFILVAIFGGLTLYLQDDTFIKMKPTILNLMFALALMGGLAFGNLFLKTIFGDGWEIVDAGWRKLTIRWALFFVFLAVLNEVIWRNFSEEFWVNFKVWGNLPLTLIFAVSQFLMIQKYAFGPERFTQFVGGLTKDDEVREALERLRDRDGANLPVLAAALWHGSEGRTFEGADIEARLAENARWEAERAAPLRQFRAQWDVSDANAESVAAKDRLFAAERDIEEQQLRALAQGFDGPIGGGTLELASENARRVVPQAAQDSSQGSSDLDMVLARISFR